MPEKSPSPVPPTALATVVAGIAFVTLATSALDGLPRGLGQGAGIAMILLGVAVLSAHLRTSRSEADMWLPSRDERRP